MAKKSPDARPTKPVRLHTDVADLAEKLAPVFGESVPDFLSNRLRVMLDGLRREAAERILAGAGPAEGAPAPKRRRGGAR